MSDWLTAVFRQAQHDWDALPVWARPVVVGKVYHMATEHKTADISKSVGMQVMDHLNETGPVAMMGHNLDDGSYEFLLGPVYMPHDEISLTAPTERRQLLVNVRLEDATRATPRRVVWMARQGDGHRETGQPDQAIVIDTIETPPDEDMFTVYYHFSV